MNDTRAFQRGLLAGTLMMLGANAVHWFISHPEVSTSRTVMVGLQLAIGLGGAAWLVFRHRRALAASHA